MSIQIDLVIDFANVTDAQNAYDMYHENFSFVNRVFSKMSLRTDVMELQDNHIDWILIRDNSYFNFHEIINSLEDESNWKLHDMTNVFFNAELKSSDYSGITQEQYDNIHNSYNDHSFTLDFDNGTHIEGVVHPV